VSHAIRPGDVCWVRRLTIPRCLRFCRPSLPDCCSSRMVFIQYYGGFHLRGALFENRTAFVARRLVRGECLSSTLPEVHSEDVPFAKIAWGSVLLRGWDRVATGGRVGRDGISGNHVRRTLRMAQTDPVECLVDATALGISNRRVANWRRASLAAFPTLLRPTSCGGGAVVGGSDSRNVGNSWPAWRHKFASFPREGRLISRFSE